MLVLVLGWLCFSFQYAYAQEKGEFINDVIWDAQKDNEGRFILNEKMAFAWLPELKVSGKWIELSAVSVDETPFRVWLHMFVGDFPLVKPLPTVCKLKNNQSVCSSIAWIHPSYANKVRASFIADQRSSVISEIQIKVLAGERRGLDVERFGKLLDQVRKVFFKTKDVNWPVIHDWALPALTAPQEIDPLPYVMALAASQLPSKKHILVYETLVTSSAEIDKSVVVPHCNYKNNQAVITLPQASDVNQDHYVKEAHRCFNSTLTKNWIIDLRNNIGGNTAVQLAALAPVLGQGVVLNYLNSEGEKIPVSINKLGVFNGSHLQYQFNLDFSLLQNKENITVLIGRGCASACEAVAISLRSKSNAKLVGEDTAGFATSNESIKINDRFSIAITAGYMANVTGQVIYPKVTPDIKMSDEEISRIFTLKQ